MPPRQHKKITTYCFLKFGSGKHMQSLVESGHVYFNPIQTFVKSHDKNVRGDEWEDAQRIIQPSQLESFKFDNTELDHLIAGPTTMHGGSRQCPATHVFCVCHVPPSTIVDSDQIVSSRMRDFGDHLVFIHKPKSFVDRFQEKATSAGMLQYMHNAVAYVPNDYHGEYDIFKKREMYSWQREYRFTLNVPEKYERPVIVDLGSLEDIAILVPLKRFINRIHREEHEKTTVLIS